MATEERSTAPNSDDICRQRLRDLLKNHLNCAGRSSVKSSGGSSWDSWSRPGVEHRSRSPWRLCRLKALEFRPGVPVQVSMMAHASQLPRSGVKTVAEGMSAQRSRVVLRAFASLRGQPACPECPGKVCAHLRVRGRTAQRPSIFRKYITPQGLWVLRSPAGSTRSTGKRGTD